MYLDKIYQQNPWFEKISNLKNDPHIVGLSRSDFIWRWRNFLDHSFSDGVYIVTGLRQIGKSTHLKLFIKEKITEKNKNNFFYFNFDLLDSKKEVVDLLLDYLKNIPDRKQRIYLLLDEITSVKDSILAIKYLIDSGFKKNITYILTGSSSVNLRKSGEYLPGRRGKGRDFVFSPLSFKEFLILTKGNKIEKLLNKFNKKTNLAVFYEELKADGLNIAEEFDKYLVCGGIPKVINVYLAENKIPPEIFEIYLSWIKSEVAKNGRKEHIVKIILERVLKSLSTDLSYNSISQDAGIGSHNTVYDYLAFLEDIFVIRQLYNYDFSQKRINYRKNKKIYFIDPFVYWLADWWIKAKSTQDFAALKDDVLKSRLVENVAAGELFKIHGSELFFHRSTFEIDFISKKNAWEVKYQNRIASQEIKNVLKFPGKKIILSKKDLKVSEELTVLPIEYFLLL